MTVQEIQEIGFEKAVFGGYDMKSVDTFLERVAEEFAAMQKENAALKAKMKVLVDKIEEYRGRENNMGRVLSIAEETLNRAKEEADTMVAKAKKEAEGIISSAKTESANKLKTTQAEIDTETQKLETARKNTVEFIARVSAVYQALVELAKAEKLVREDKPAAPQQTAPVQNAQQQEKTAAAAQQEKADAPVEDATRKFDFGELKFGADYDPKEVK